MFFFLFENSFWSKWLISTVKLQIHVESIQNFSRNRINGTNTYCTIWLYCRFHQVNSSPHIYMIRNRPDWPIEFVAAYPLCMCFHLGLARNFHLTMNGKRFISWNIIHIIKWFAAWMSLNHFVLILLIYLNPNFFLSHCEELLVVT